jgi:hypothetical protein
MDRAAKSRREIEGLVLRELQGCDGCEGAVSISVHSWDARDELPNWTVESFDPGNSDDFECERALADIVSRLQGFYELVQKH